MPNIATIDDITLAAYTSPGFGTSPVQSGGYKVKLSTDTFNLAGGAVSDLFAAMGDKASAGLYTQAAAFARQNEQFTKESTALKEFQQQRQAFKVIGEQKADVAGAGFAEGGSALDLLRESTQQAALAKEIVAQQGLIQEAGYEQQAASYTTMASASNTAATGALVSAGIKAASAVFSLIP